MALLPGLLAPDFTLNSVLGDDVEEVDPSTFIAISP